YDASVLTAERPVADYFEQLILAGLDPKLSANWVSSELLGRLNKAGTPITESPIAPAGLAELLGLIVDKTISGKIAKDLFDRMWAEPGRGAREIVKAEGLVQVTDDAAIEDACRAANR